MDLPTSADALHRNGVEAYQSGGSTDALRLIAEAVRLAPNRADFRNNLGLVLSDSDPEGAIAAFREAVAIQPNLALAHKNLAMMLAPRGAFDEAIAEFSLALEFGADVVAELSEMAEAMRHRANLYQALECYDRILAARPQNPVIAGERCYLLQHLSHFDGQAILREHRAWNDRFAKPLQSEIRPHENDRDPDRRLRSGYVSPDFKNHCQKFFTIPLFSNHDHKAFEIYCYSSVDEPDDVTHKIRQYADLWRAVAGETDEKLAEIIRRDRVDILVDLTMHMPHGRPLLFARKPAPVQIAWLAYPGTTGLDAMNYRLTDPYLDPPGEGDANYSEKSIRLPNTFWCFDPGRGGPAVQALPALRNGFVTFGCLNNFCKVNQDMVRIWGKVLQELPNSRLVLRLDPSIGAVWVPRVLGVDPSRVEFIGHHDHHDFQKVFHRIDLGLDVLPYNGHTTSLDSYWMGVPVVTLVGKTVVGRAGLSQLNNLGLTELVAFNEADFVRIAVGLANDLPRLSELRRTLRRRMQNSPLMDAPKFARDVENIYRQVWREWVRSHVPG